MGIGDKIKGAVKQKVGAATDKDGLEAEGRAQERKGDEQIHESKDRAEAQAHEKKARALDAEQQALEE